MTDSFTYRGVWFLSENPNHKVSGTLFFDPQKGIELELDGTLMDARSSKDLHEPDTILGFTIDGKSITLYKCFESSRSMSLPGMATSKYVGLFVLEGAHFDGADDVIFHSVRARLHNLDTWTSRFGFSAVETDFNTWTTRIEYTIPDAIEFPIRVGTKGKLNFRVTVPSSQYLSTATIEQKVELIIEHEEALALDKILSDFFHFQNFITLGTFEPSHVISVELTHRGLTEEWSGTLHPVPIRLFYQPSTRVAPARSKVLWEFLFNYRDIEVKFNQTIAEWYDHKASLEPIIALLLDSFYKKGSFTENTFLNIAQGLETFHRRFRNNQVRPADAHEKMIATILAATPTEHRDWLKERLNFSNEPSLHKRLDELVDELSNTTIRKIITDKEAFIKDVKNSRNYYTHYEKSIEKKAKKGGELFTLTEKMKVVLVCAVLRQTGFTAEEIEALFARNEFKFFNHILASDEVSS
jgi:hypothetical protein